MLSSTVSGTEGNYVITDCPGYHIRLKNNLAFYSTNSNTHIHASGTHLVNLNTSSGSISHNSFSMNSVSVSGSDFQSVNLSQLTSARSSDGSLPSISCLHLATGSDLINAGVAINGIPFNGSAPDLGCFETNTVKSEVIDRSEPISTLSVYPNPGQTDIHVEGVPETAVITIHDTQGNQVLTAQSAVIDVRSLPAGVYFIRCENTHIKWVKN